MYHRKVTQCGNIPSINTLNRFLEITLRKQKRLRGSSLRVQEKKFLTSKKSFVTTYYFSTDY